MIDVAVVGCGGMADSHADAFTGEDRTRVVAAVDTERDRAEGTATAFDGATAVTDYRDVLGEVDAALIALPHHLHHPVATDFLEAGAHVLLEKPMAITEEECLDLIDTAEAVDRTLMVAYIQRFNPLVRELKGLLDREAYGEVFQLSIWTEQLTRYSPGHWALDEKRLGGGQLFSHGCHYIDLLLWFLGSPVEGTHTGTSRGTPWMDREGTSQVNLTFESGATGYHFGTWGARGSRLRYSIHAHCTGGMIEADLTGGTVVGIEGETETQHLEAGAAKPTGEQLSHFIDCVETGQTPLTDPKRSLQSLRVIWRLYEAEEEGVVADLGGCGLEEFSR